MDLVSLGWNSRLSREFEPFASQGLAPGRVASDQRHIYTVISENGELAAEVSGRFRLDAAARGDFPVVGDWVAVAARWEEESATIAAVLPRSSCLVRRNAGEKTEEQPVAANVDLVIIVSGLDNDFNPRRLERFLTIAWASGASPAIILNKLDACDDTDARLAEVLALAPGVPVLATSAARGDGLDALRALLVPGRTAVFVGSSGVGKSTLTNRLLGTDRQETLAVRQDDSRGRHATTRRDLVVLPGGAILIDNPGMREVGLWGEEADLSGSFPDIEALAAGCRFADCRHEAEPGCAVRRALEDHSLNGDRYASYLKLRRELAWVEARSNDSARQLEKQRWQGISKLRKKIRRDASTA